MGPQSRLEAHRLAGARGGWSGSALPDGPLYPPEKGKWMSWEPALVATADCHQRITKITKKNPCQEKAIAKKLQKNPSSSLS